MKIALLGYGKMGKTIESIAIERGHEIVLKVTSQNKDYSIEELSKADVAIEFSVPDSVKENIFKCFEANIPIVVGTTAWYNEFESISEMCLTKQQSLFYATNFSIGVNLFFEVNKKLASFMNEHRNYDVSMEEIHHTQKLDSPSGTAITLAEQIIENVERKHSWREDQANLSVEFPIYTKRKPEVPGTHSITWESDIDKIEITHEAKNRKGFAKGAVIAAEWLVDKKGIFTMSNMMKL